jgi:hypothetical protein
MAYILTCYTNGGPSGGARVGRRYATVDDAKRAARLEAEAHGRLLRAWRGDGARGGAPAWATATTTDGRERYLVERERAGDGSGSGR